MQMMNSKLQFTKYSFLLGLFVQNIEYILWQSHGNENFTQHTAQHLKFIWGRDIHERFSFKILAIDWELKSVPGAIIS